MLSLSKTSILFVYSDFCPFSALISNHKQDGLRAFSHLITAHCHGNQGGNEAEAARQTTRSHLNAAAYGHLWQINDGRIGRRMFFIIAPTSICQRCWATGHALRPLQIVSVISSSTLFPSPLPPSFLSSVPGKIMLNRAISSWTQGRDHSAGGYTSISRIPTQTSGIRKRWRTFGQGARSILCICAEGHTDADYTTTTTTTTGADVPRGGSSAPNSVGRSRPGKASTSKEAESAWFDQTTRKLRRLHAEPGAAARRRPRKRAARSGQGSQSYDDDLHHRMARLHLIATTATGERIHAPPTASGNRTDAPRPRKPLLIGANNPREEEPGAEKPPPQSSHLQGPENDEKVGADARKAAWEVLKRRVLDAEEHGGEPPLDMGGGGGHDADRALRNIRARLRQGWAEEVMRVKAREESVKSTKKRRRDAGCWIRENGALLKCTVAHHTRALENTLH